MTSEQVKSPLLNQMQLLTEVINQSPYISRAARVTILKEIEQLTLELDGGTIPSDDGEKKLSHLYKQVAIDEITALISKIRYLNPSSPRLENLNALEHNLKTDALTPEQAREKLLELMKAKPH